MNYEYQEEESMRDALKEFNTDTYEEVLKEGELFESYSDFFSSLAKAYSNFPSLEVENDLFSKDIGATSMKRPNVNEKLKRTMQK